MSGRSSKSEYASRQKSVEEQKAKELLAMRKEVDAQVVMVQSIRSNLERVPAKLEALVEGFSNSIQMLAGNYDLRDVEKPTAPIVSGVVKTSSGMATELGTTTRTAFQEHSLKFLKNWLGALGVSE